jgi:hypothetical protein
MSFFFFYKIRKKKRTGQFLPGGNGTSGRGEDVGKGCVRVNIVQLLYTHVCKWKMIPVETIPGNEVGGIKENVGRDEFKYDIFDVY